MSIVPSAAVCGVVDRRATAVVLYGTAINGRLFQLPAVAKTLSIRLDSAALPASASCLLLSKSRAGKWLRKKPQKLKKT